jgi:hypothetical protein
MVAACYARMIRSMILTARIFEGILVCQADDRREERDVEKDKFEMPVGLQDLFNEKIALPEFVKTIVDERWPFGSAVPPQLP